jgi:pimeloyl-ACP methyl ester carboxylesterase
MRLEARMDRISTSRGDFEYETRGSGEPLILIHGAVSAETDHCLLDQTALTDRYAVTLYHRRGFLGSPPHTGPFSIVEQAADARAVIEAVVGGPAHISGHSYGGATLLQLALDAPDLVYTLALREPPMPVASAEAFLGRVADVQALYEAGKHAEAIDGFLDIALGPGEYKSSMQGNMPEGWLERAVADIDTLFQVEFPALGEWELTKEMASRIEQPVLSVVGARSHQFFHEGDALLREWIPQAETFVLPNASHGLQYMNPRGMAEGLVAFLEKHPMRVATPA